MEYIIIYYIYRWNHGILPWSIYQEFFIYFDYLDFVVYTRGIFRKSTFFNVLTKSSAAAENFPFCTIG